MTMSDNTIETMHTPVFSGKLLSGKQSGGSLQVQIDLEPLPAHSMDQSTHKVFVKN